MAVKEEVSLPTQRTCSRCYFVSSQEVCKACVLLEGLNKGLPKLGIGKSSKAKRMIEEFNANQIKKESIRLAVNDIDENQIGNVICKSNSKTCNSGMCKSKRKNPTKHSDCNIHNNEAQCNNKCSENVERTGANNVVNAKVDSLLEKYEINESAETELNNKECITSNSNTHNTNANVLDSCSDDEEKHHIAEDDETCSSSCGRLGSLHIGF